MDGTVYLDLPVAGTGKFDWYSSVFFTEHQQCIVAQKQSSKFFDQALADQQQLEADDFISDSSDSDSEDTRPNHRVRCTREERRMLAIGLRIDLGARDSTTGRVRQAE